MFYFNKHYLYESLPECSSGQVVGQRSDDKEERKAMKLRRKMQQNRGENSRSRQSETEGKPVLPRRGKGRVGGDEAGTGPHTASRTRQRALGFILSEMRNNWNILAKE